MFKNLALIGFCTAGLLAAGCRDTQTFMPPVDLMHNPTDGGNGGGGDMSVPKNYMTTTIHDIDTGNTAPMTAVKVTGVIATTVVSYFKSHKKTICTYEVYVQDPACRTGP